MYYDKDGNSYKYMEVEADGSKIFHNGLILTKEKKERLDYIISRAWDNLPDEKKIEINEKIKLNKKNNRFRKQLSNSNSRLEKTKLDS